MKGGGGIPKFVLIMIILFIVTSAGTAIASFFGINFEAYAPYIVWFIALALFYFLLPGEVKNLFEDIKG
jgi:hypothetical protein